MDCSGEKKTQRTGRIACTVHNMAQHSNLMPCLKMCFLFGRKFIKNKFAHNNFGAFKCDAPMMKKMLHRNKRPHHREKELKRLDPGNFVNSVA